METIRPLYKECSSLYNKSQPHLHKCRELAFAAHEKVTSEAEYSFYGQYGGTPAVAYNVFRISGSEPSRPIRPDLYVHDHAEFTAVFDSFVGSLSGGTKDWSEKEIHQATAAVYTAVMSFASCYDLWQRTSRKTPGTFFEILVAGLLKKMLPSATFSKHISLSALVQDSGAKDSDNSISDNNDAEDLGANVSTDLVIGSPDRTGGVVVPLKITTRERIVQPFAHQRILDSAFGEGVYHSLLLCISETQLDDRTQSVKQVCVPGTVKLFQKYLAPIVGLYYCDVPQRYDSDDIKNIMPVRSFGDFFTDIEERLEAQKTNGN